MRRGGGQGVGVRREGGGEGCFCPCGGDVRDCTERNRAEGEVLYVLGRIMTVMIPVGGLSAALFAGVFYGHVLRHMHMSCYLSFFVV